MTPELVPALILGLVQGLTEFLPISSDGHLAIASMLFGGTPSSLALVVLLHLGTLAATVVVLRDDVLKLVRTLATPSHWRGTEEGAALRTIVITSIPTAIVGLALHDRVEAWAESPLVVGACLLLSAAAVASTRWTGARATKESLDLPVWQCVVIGIAQGLAVLPGLTRSGSTIAVAMLLGIAGPAAFRLSFLLSLPAIAGAALLELRHPDVWSTLGLPAIAGALVAFAVGLAALLGLRHIVARGRFWAFAIYLVPLGAILLWVGSTR
ncbi:MAG: undecaprenyl-diphosphate phosphatase [Sandaracinus sp.]